MSWCRTNTFPRDKPWGKRISQLSTSGVCFYVFLLHIISPVPSKQFLGMPTGPPHIGACCLLHPTAVVTAPPPPPQPTRHATHNGHPRTSGHLAVQLRSIAPQSFVLPGQLRGVTKSPVLTRSISWRAAPSLAPITSPYSQRGAGIWKLPARWLTRSLPLPFQGFFLCRTDGHKLFGNHRPTLPQTPQKDASPEQGAIPSRPRHSTLFRGAGKSLTRLSFNGGGRAAFHSHDKLLLSKLHECSY